MLGVRNQFKGKVCEIKKGAINGLVKVDVGNGIVFTSNTSIESIDALGLTVGKDCVVFIKAMEVILANEKLNIGTRNQVEGTITEINKGSINALVKLKVNDNITISSNTSMESVDALGLQVGQKAVAVFKAMSVVVATE